MASPKDKPKKKPNRLTNDFRYVPEKKAVAKYDPLSVTSRYLDKLGNQLAEETAYQMKAIPEVYGRNPIEGLQGTTRFLADGANQLFIKPIVHGYHATEGLVEHNDGTVGSNLANLGILGLSLVDIADMTEISKPLTHLGIDAIKGIGKEMTKEISEDVAAKSLRQELVNMQSAARGLEKQELHQLEHHIATAPKEGIKTAGSHETVKGLEHSTNSHNQEQTHASNISENNSIYNQDIERYIEYLDSLKTKQLNDYNIVMQNAQKTDTPKVLFMESGKLNVPSRVEEQLQSMFMR